MKKIFTLLSVLLLLTSCDSKLDIVPKGKTTLSTVSDLETLLEQRFMLSSTANYETLVGNTFPVLWDQPGKALPVHQLHERDCQQSSRSLRRCQ